MQEEIMHESEVRTMADYIPWYKKTWQKLTTHVGNTLDLTLTGLSSAANIVMSVTNVPWATVSLTSTLVICTTLSSLHSTHKMLNKLSRKSKNPLTFWNKAEYMIVPGVGVIVTLVILGLFCAYNTIIDPYLEHWYTWIVNGLLAPTATIISPIIKKIVNKNIRSKIESTKLQTQQSLLEPEERNEFHLNGNKPIKSLELLIKLNFQRKAAIQQQNQAMKNDKIENARLQNNAHRAVYWALVSKQKEQEFDRLPDNKRVEIIQHRFYNLINNKLAIEHDAHRDEILAQMNKNQETIDKLVERHATETTNLKQKYDETIKTEQNLEKRNKQLQTNISSLTKQLTDAESFNKKQKLIINEFKQLHDQMSDDLRKTRREHKEQQNKAQFFEQQLNDKQEKHATEIADLKTKFALEINELSEENAKQITAHNNTHKRPATCETQTQCDIIQQEATDDHSVTNQTKQTLEVHP